MDTCAGESCFWPSEPIYAENPAKRRRIEMPGDAELLEYNKFESTQTTTSTKSDVQAQNDGRWHELCDNDDIPFKMVMPSSQLRDLDLVRWLDNKLGDNSEVWSGRQAASLLSREMLIELQTCFQALEPHVKLKIVLAYPHLSYRLVSMWRGPLESLLDLARRDADDWVETIAHMYRDYPSRQCILPNLTNIESYFQKSLTDLRAIVKQQKFDEFLRLLPLDLFALSQTASKSRYGLPDLENRNHFGLKRRAKSSILKAEVVKSAEGVVRSKTIKLEVICSSVPIRIRSTVRKPNNDLPMRGIPKANTCKLSAGFTNEPRKFQRQLSKRGGAKFIDINELPQALKLRRKEQEEEEKAKKKNEKEEHKKRLHIERAEKKSPESTTSNTIPAEPANAKVVHPEASKTVANGISPQVEKLNGTLMSENNNASSSHKRQSECNPESCDLSGNVENSNIPKQQEKSTLFQNGFSAVNSAAEAAREAQREAFVKRQCEEMLGSANVLNEEGQRMVTVFMSGNRVHPYPHLGDVVTLKLSESLENDVLPDGTCQKVRVETFFQMDYRTGEWKRLRKTRALRPEELLVMQQTMFPQQMQTATIR